jgi:hypothetical protein
MNERKLLFRISNIVNGPISIPQAAEQIARLLEREAGGRGLFFDYPDDGRESYYTVELQDGGEHFGKLTMVFVSDQTHAEFQRRIANFVGEQLGMLMAQTRLSEQRARLKREIALMKEDLAARKLLQRAEGLLIARRGLTAAEAKRWISETSRKAGLSTNDLANRIIEYYQDVLERRIA